MSFGYFSLKYLTVRKDSKKCFEIPTAYAVAFLLLRAKGVKALISHLVSPKIEKSKKGLDFFQKM